jgi:hypothetical protein
MNNVFKDFRFIKRKLRFIINKLFYKDYTSNKNKLGKLNSILDDVKKHGISKCENFVEKNLLNTLILEFEKIVSKKEITDRNQVQLDPQDGLDSPIYKNFFYNNEIFDLLGKNYLMTNNFDKSAGGKRIFPMKPKEFANYQWHHDGEYRCFKIFILLNDLDDVGQKMEYLKGSHKLYNTSFNKIFKNDDQLLDNYEKISLIGKKGTCYFFDGNGLHRGNRNQSYTRDILAITYRYLD